jgi:tetratricopeptide (TPR) repeat protein
VADRLAEQVLDPLPDMSTVVTVADLARLLRHLRRRQARQQGDAQLSHREIAARTGWSHGIVGAYLSGQVLPPTDRFDVLIRLLGATPAELGALATARDRVEEHRRGETPAAASRAVPAHVVPRQLPPAVPYFVGREAELVALTALVGRTAKSGSAVVISAIDGTAGIGKTALAVWGAHRLAARFPDGQLYVDLRGFDPAGRPLSVAEAVRGFLDAFAVPAGRIPVTLDGQIGLYRSLLADRRVLVVLDNARDAAHARPLLPGAPGCLVLVTSRRRLSGLVADAGAYPMTIDLLPPAEGRELLVHRIGADRAAAEPGAVDGILAACAGLPLALSIVAARAATQPQLSLAGLATELHSPDARLDALDLGDADAGVRAIFSWSYHALSAGAARLFRLLGLHSGPDIATAPAASIAGLPVPQVRPLLAELTRAHLLEEPASGRYSCHDLLRTYATELAAKNLPAEDRQAAVHRLLDHYLHTAHAATLLLNPHRNPISPLPARSGVTVTAVRDHDEALAWFTVEHRALLAAIGLATAVGLDTHAWQLAWAIMTYLDRCGHRADWAATQCAALAAAQRSGDPIGQAHAHRGLGRAYIHLGRFDEAAAHLRQALDLHGALADQAGAAQTHLDLAWLCERRNDQREALHHAERALEIYRAAGHRYGQANALNAVGWQHAQLGDHQRALDCCCEAIDIHREVGDRPGEADTWDSLGYVHHQLGGYAEAVSCFRQAIELYRGAGNRYVEASTLLSLGETHCAAGDLDAARTTWQAALALFEESERPDSAAQVHARLQALDRP